MDGREGGFIVVQRRVRSSRLYRSLTGEQRSVFYTLLILANWKPDAILVGATWHEVKRGELAHKLETIAAEAAVSVKVVRTTLVKLFADDRPAGGRGPFLTERYVGAETGRPKRILTVVNYDEYQDVGQDEGTVPGTIVGTTGARDGHDRGTTGAPREPVKPVQPEEPHRRTARLGLGHPAYEAVEHWTGVVWPRLSEASCPDITTTQAQSLAHLSGKHGPGAVCAAMDAAAADEYWARRLDLAAFINNVGKFLARKTPGRPASSSSRKAIGVDDNGQPVFAEET